MKKADKNKGQLLKELDQLSGDYNRLKESVGELTKYKKIVSISTDMLALVDKNYTYLLTNEAYGDALGYSPEELPGKSVQEVFGDSFFNRTIKPHGDRCLNGEEVYYHEYFEFPSTGRRFMSVKYSPNYNTTKQITGFYISGRDISSVEKENRDRMELLESLGKVGGWTLDLETMTPTFSKEAYAIYELEPPEIPPIEEGIKYYNIEDQPKISKALQKCIKTGEPYDLELRFVSAKGAKLWVRTMGRAEKVNGIIVKLSGIIQDITKRKLSEETVRESEVRYHELVDTITSGVAVYKVINDGKTGGDYIIQDFNKAALELEGMTKKQVLGKKLIEIRPNIDDYGLIPIFEKVWKTGVSDFLPSKVYIDDKYSNYYENQVFRLPNGNIVAIYNDVTERENTVLLMKRNKERLDLALNATQDGLYDWNLLNNEIYYSPPWKKMLGYEEDELPNDLSVWESLIEKEDLGRSWKMQKELVSKQRDRFELEFRMKHKKGHWVDILSRAEAVFDDKGKAIRIVGTHVDITLSKKLENELKLKNLAFEASIAANSTSDTNGILTHVNSAFLRIWDYDSIDEVIGKNLSRFFKDTDRAQEMFNSLQKSGTWAGEYIGLKKNGTTFNAYGIANTIKGDREEAIGYYSGALDITTRKQAENKLHQSYTFNDSLLKNIPFGMDIIDQDGNLLFLSDNLKEIIGENGIGRKCWELYKDDKTQCENCPIRKEIVVGETGTYQSSDVLGGRVFEISHTGMMFKGEKAMLEIFQDVTERNKYENDLLHAKEKAEESDNLKSAFLNNISHEIRTPLNAIVGFSDIINKPDLLPDEREDFSNIIKRSSDQLLSVVEDILSIATIEAKQDKYFESEVNINMVLDLITHQYSTQTADKDVTLKLIDFLPDDKAIVCTDLTKLTQILTNLIGNALKFTPKGFVNFGYALKNDQLEFYVADSGIGIPLGMEGKIFERFRQVENSATKNYGGSGLGLAISKAYVELLQGKIWATSKIGEGSVFYFTIPYKQSSLEKMPATPVNIESRIAVKDNKTILIAEDEDINYYLLENLLPDANLNLIRAKDGTEAVKICKSDQQIDLVLMDIKMPKMDGYEASKRIIELKPELYIIALSAFTSEAHISKAYDCGCSDYICKPINREILISKIEEQLNITKS